MLSPAAPTAGPAHRSAGPGSAARLRRAALALALLVLAAAVAFPLAPVEQPRVSYTWTAADGAAAIPLMPYQPVALTAAAGCAAVREGGVLLSTVPLRPDPAASPLPGLRIVAEGGEVAVSSAGGEFARVPLSGGSCAVEVVFDTDRTVLRVGDREVVRPGDRRPAVAGAFSEVDDGVTLALTADTRFQTSPSPLKLALGAVAVLALLGVLAVLAVLDRRTGRRVRLLPHRWWRPGPADAAVVAGAVLWWLVGAVTVDDGYIAGIVRSRGENGFVGNAYRWLNAPEAPFSWFYDVLHLWSLVSPSTLWMRLPSVLLGLLTWVLLTRALLPRLGPGADRPWLAALAFGTWWVPFQLGLRPEPWVAVGLLAVVLAVERAVATRRLLPVAVGLVLAGATTALTPGGLIAFTPFAAAAVPLLRLVRAHPAGWAQAALLPALPATAVLLMVSDQSLAAVLEATRVRQLIGGGVEWYQEYERYALLLEPDSFQGAIGRRAAVLVTLLAAAGVLARLRRARAGLATGPARRTTAVLLLSLAVLTATPTKWTQHFGDVAGIGAAVLVLGAATWASAPLRARPRAFTTGLAAATAVGALVLAGYNAWPFASGWFAPTFSDRPPELLGQRVTTLALVAGLLVVAALAGRAAWARSSGAPEPPVPRRVPGPVPALALVLAGVLALQVLSLARTAVEQRGSYTPASDALALLTGRPCGLQERLSVETDPAAGLLAGGAVPGTRPVDVGGATLPAMAVAGDTTTAWRPLDPGRRDLPVVVTVSGALRPGDTAALEWGDDRGAVLGRVRLTAGDDEGGGVRDVRLPAPERAASVRLAVSGGPGAEPALVTLPRVPVLTPMTEVVPPGSPAVLDWPVAFVFPCLAPAPLALGSADLPTWRVAPPAADPAAGITYDPAFGGPFAAPRLLVTEQRMATYLDGDPLRDAAQVVRWTPVQPLARPEPVITSEAVPGWARNGSARVPGLDTVG